MQIATLHVIDALDGQLLVGWMGAIPQHKARPVFAEIGLLQAPIHLDGILRRMVIVLDAHHRIAVITERKEMLDIGQKDHVRIHKQRPAFEGLQGWH